MRHLSLCTGYGGIDLALEAAFGAQTVAVADIDPGACRVLAHRYPDAPNLGDISAVDWSQWAGRVDLISGGTPCQDLSHAGRRAGMTEGTRSNLWVQMREAIAITRPALITWENVRGAYSAEADSALEPCPGCVGGPRDSGPALRALGRVLGDLSSLGYDALWYGIRASDVGAAHHRYRVFVFAWPADAAGDTWRLINGDGRARGANPVTHGLDGWTPVPFGHQVGRAAATWGREVPQQLMPTPAASWHNDTEDADAWLARRELVKETARNGNSMGMPLGVAVRTLPTPNSYAGEGGGPQDPEKRRAGGHRAELDDVVSFLPTQDWREYEPAIRRQEAAFGRPAPAPTELGPKGSPRLAAPFSEWLMGLPAGWITDPAMWADTAPSAARSQQLKLAGNGVVPQQCYTAAQRFRADFERYVRAPTLPIEVSA